MKLEQTTAKNSYRYGWLLKRIFPYIKPYMGRIFLSLMVAIPLGLLDGVTAFALKPYMDYVVGQQDLIVNWKFIHIDLKYTILAFVLPFAVVIFAAIQGLLRYLNEYLTQWISQKITISVKSDLFTRMVNMDTKFYDENSSGIVISRYMNDPQTAASSLVDQLTTMITSTFGAIGLITVMLYSSWRLAIVGVAVLTIAFLPVALIRNVIKRTSNQSVVIGGNITTNINETYIGNKIICSYGLQDRQDKKIKQQLRDSFDVSMSLLKRAAWMSPMMYLIASVGIAIVLWYGTDLILRGVMTAGGFASFVTSLLLLYKPVKNLGRTLQFLQTVFVALCRVFELFDLEPEVQNLPDAVAMKGIQQSVRFENVNFEYTEGVPVLKNINFEINKGETVAIVGNSGGGKSTIANLIPRFYDVTSGAIKIDGTNIKNFTLDSLRHHIAMVFQDNFLFSATIKENIMLGNPDASDEQLKSAVQAAHLEEMLAEMPDGIDTELSERGVTLSGGQRQRVAIARAIIKDAPIIILDEATSALDNESEAIVQKALDNLIKNKTVFLIAHRFTTIKNANRIIVINEGEIVESGTHDELMSIDDGHYKHLYEMQFKHQDKTNA
ncbi:ABC transporter ATP-binding protein [bacterium]|nr:ABC transporter ATP-binding protein [bacterium]